MGNSKLGRFDHLIVVMFENRSFDSVLGYLYDAETVFDGVAGTANFNPVPSYMREVPPVTAQSRVGANGYPKSRPGPRPSKASPRGRTAASATSK